MRLYKIKAQVVSVECVPEHKQSRVRVKHANGTGGTLERTVYFPESMKITVGDWVEVSWDKRP